MCVVSARKSAKFQLAISTERKNLAKWIYISMFFKKVKCLRYA